MEPGGDGKADRDGTVDIDDVAREVPRDRFSFRVAQELGEFKKPRIGDRCNDDRSVELFISGAGGARSCGDGLSEIGCGRLFERRPVSCSSLDEQRSE